MGEQNASLAVKQSTKDDLDKEYYGPEYPSQDVLVKGMMAALPTQEQIEEGCYQCDKPFHTTKFEELNAVIHTFYSEEHDHRATRIFCSESCFHEARESERADFPHHPQKVVVGGKDELRAVIGDAEFIIDGNRMEVSIDVPAAFSGTDSHGDEYDYEGEPVFIQNDGDEWVQDGLVDDIINEEAHTALVLDPAHAENLEPHHPDPEVREDFFENSIVCPECERRYRYYDEDNLPFDCVDCSSPVPGHKADDADDDQ